MGQYSSWGEQENNEENVQQIDTYLVLCMYTASFGLLFYMGFWGGNIDNPEERRVDALVSF